MQIQALVRYHVLRMAVIRRLRNNKCWRDGMEKKEPSCTVGGNKLVQPQWRTAWRFLKNKVSLYGPAVPLLGFPEGIIIWKNTYTLMFIAALFRVSHTWQHPECPSTDECVKIYTCTMQYYSVIKNNKIMALRVTWMDLEIIILSEVSQKMKDAYVESKI